MNNDTDKNCRKALQVIKEAKNILLITHDRPDGDAISSLAAMIEFLASLNKKFSAYSHDEVPGQLYYLPGTEKIKGKFPIEDFYNYDVIITLDCGSAKRTNIENELLNKKDNQIIVEFDHHPKIDDYSDLEIRLPGCSSTTEVLYQFFKNNSLKINKNLANCLLTGILTDTANFLYPNATEETIKIASEMLLYGAKFPTITENTQRNKSLPAMKTWGQAINNLRINKKYGLAFSVLTEKDIKKSGATEEELEGISGFLSNLSGIKALLLIREEENIIKGSLRTANSNLNISKLAQILGGGGHAKASGFAIEGKIEKTNNGWKII